MDSSMVPHLGIQGREAREDILIVNSTHSITFEFSSGVGTNNHAAAYILLQLAKKRTIQELKVFGDSHLVCGWLEGQLQSRNITLKAAVNNNL